ncbi:hypothetical protein CCACVL1_05224 [Corchorus capsularis]|uniref:Bifunctional inhibitor/plant lipid transfer protein/seed storage helical domain-containing protein n=1 Tax=Corchorus capsularis TaxID=210143 RepID=A0A1R3JLU5_COCAP|nr:hypothetical protein CCACVL1_05224 [Corchorus capsularis]
MTILDNLGENIVAGFLEQESEDGGHEDDGMECIQMLMPCGPYMHSSSPPAICCNPLNDVIKTDAHCLCKASNDPQIKKNFNITLDQALALPKACGIQVDSSVCKNGTQQYSLISFPS